MRGCQIIDTMIDGSLNGSANVSMPARRAAVCCSGIVATRSEPRATAIGVTFSALLLWTYGLGWARSPAMLPALFVGVATVVAPLLILQPAMGAGIASRNTPTPVFSSIKNLVTHTVFGVGMYLAALATAVLIPVAD